MSRERTPLIAGNWKMHKTVEAAEEFIAALLPRVSAVRTDRGGDLPARSPRLQAMVDSTRGSRVAVYAQTMHQAQEGAFTGEVSAEDALRGRRPRRHPRSLRAAPDVRRDRQGAGAEAPGRARGGLHRSCASARPGRARAGDTDAGCATRFRRACDREPEQVAALVDRLRADLGDRHRTRGDARAGPGCDRLRARAGRRPFRDAAPDTRILYGGSVKAENAAELLACPTSTARWSAGASSTPSRLRQSSPPRDRGLPWRSS